MQNFKTQVEFYVGESLSSDLSITATDLGDVLTHGARIVVERMPPDKLKRFLQSSTFTTSKTIEDGKVFNVTRSDGTIVQDCREIPRSLVGRVGDSEDILYATENDPVFYWDTTSSATESVKVLPTPTSSKIATVYYANSPTVAATDTAINGFPNVLESAVVKYGVAQVKFSEAGLMRRKSQDELEAITTSGYLSSFESALPTFSNPSVPVMPSAGLVAMTSLPSFNAAGLEFDPPSMTSLPTLSAQTIGTAIGTLSISNTAITSASIGSCTLPSLSLPAFSSTGLSHDPASAISATISLPTMTSLPTFSAQSIGTAIGTLSLSATLNIPGLSLPSVPDAPSSAYTSVGGTPSSALTIGGTPTYTTSSTPLTIKGTDWDFSTTTISDALTKSENYMDNLSSTDFESYISNEDVEMAEMMVRGAAQEVNRANSAIQNELAQLREYEAEVQENLGKFNADIQQYRNRISEETGELAAEVSAYSVKVQDNVQSVSASLRNYQNKIARYRENVNAVVQEFRESVSATIQSFRAILESDATEWNSQKNADLKKYESDVRQEIDSYQARANAFVNEYREKVDSEIKDFSAEVGKYGTEAQAAVSEYQSRTRALIDEYQNTINGRINKYRADADRYIQRFAAEAQVQTQLWVEQKNADLKKYDSDIRQEVEAFQAKSAAYINEFQSKYQASVQEYQSKTNAYIGEYTAKNNVIISGFRENAQAELGRYTNEVQGEVSEFTSNLSKARSYLEESGIRLQTMQSFDQKAQQALQEGAVFMRDFNEEVDRYAGIVPREEKPWQTR